MTDTHVHLDDARYDARRNGRKFLTIWKGTD